MKRFLFGLTCILLSVHVTANSTAGQEKTTMCVGCHGAQGISANPDWPSLAGQHASYLAKQLRDYKNATTRNAAIMTPMVAQLTDDDINEIANYYANLPRVPEKTTEKKQTRGEEIYRRGDLEKHITACIACHGPHGTGNAQAGFPGLAGQQPAYTVLQLLAFQNKSRSNDINSIMRDISKHMSHADMTSVANYLTGLHE